MIAPDMTPVDALGESRRSSRHGTVMAVSMMKDEAPYLLEWFAHHLAVGFTDILVYTNDCTDGTVEMLERLEELGLGHHRPNVIRDGVKPQPSAISHAQAEPMVQAADWVMLLDADEFLAINHPSGGLDGMLDDTVAAGANGVVVTWRIFGSGGVVDWSPAPVTEQYLRAAPLWWNKGWGVKTLFRFDPEYWKLGIHRPAIRNRHLKGDFPASVRWLNGSGQPMPDYFRVHGWRSIRRTLGYDWAQLNHYAVKSVEAYALRKLRGNVNNKADKYNADYWALQDRNEVSDTRILRHAPRRQAIMAALLRDPVLKDLHHAALARVEARLAEYRATADYAVLRTALIAAGKVPLAKVQARPPKPRDPARIAERMQQISGAAMDGPGHDAGRGGTGDADYAAGPLSLPDDALWVANQGFLLPADSRILSGDALLAASAGKFQRRHARNIGSCLGPSRRLLEIGSGIGLVAMVALRECPELAVMAQDDRPGMVALAAAVAARNDMADTARLRQVGTALRLAGDGEGVASGLAAYLRDFQPDALRIVRPVALPPEWLVGAGLDGVRRIIIPITAEGADALRAAYGPVLAAQGFAEDAGAVDAGSILYRREGSG